MTNVYVYKVLKERGEWKCRVCRQSLQNSISVGCDDAWNGIICDALGWRTLPNVKHGFADHVSSNCLSSVERVL